MRISKSFKLLMMASALLAVTIQGLASQTVSVDVSKSKLEWMGKKVAGSHHGTVQIKSGSVVVEGEAVVSGQFEIDMNTIVDLDLENEDMNKKLVGHLKSPDFFSAEEHPVALFKLLSVTPKEGNDYLVKGELTIKGITNKIEFPATIHKMDGGYHVSADFNIDRTLWDIRFRSGKFFQNLGDKLIYDDINIKLNLMFN